MRLVHPPTTMFRAKPLSRRSERIMANVNLDGLANDRAELAQKFVDFLRTASDDMLAELWRRWGAVGLGLSEDEVEKLSLQAVRHARGRV
jgi:hypothetical protein